MNTDIRLSVEFWDHPKTIKLERRIGIEGIRSLQILWLWCRVNKPDGILTGMDPEDIEIAAKWQGETGRFVNESLTLRWLDVDGETYFLHDWPDHNPWSCESESRSDKARFSRLAKTNPAAYQKIKSEGRAEVSATEYRELTTKTNGSLTTVNASLTPAPAPAPAPIALKEPPLPPKGDSLAGDDRRKKDGRDILTVQQRQFFNLFWAAYPKKKSKGAAEKAWAKIGPDASMAAEMVAAVGRAQKSKDWLKDGGQYIPHPATWLNAKAWEDEPEVTTGQTFGGYTFD